MVWPILWISLIFTYTVRAMWYDKTYTFQTPFENILNSPYFVDKTSLIKTFIEEENLTLVATPHGYGKSTNLDMLRFFLQLPFDQATGRRLNKKTTKAYQVFNNETYNLEISKDKNFVNAHLGEYIVLVLNFTSVHGTNVEDILKNMCVEIRDLHSSFYWLFKLLKERGGHTYDITDQDLSEFVKVINGFSDHYKTLTGLSTLIKFIKLYFQSKIVVLIDGYDAPTTLALNKAVKPYLIDNFMQSIMGMFIQTTEYTEHCMVTGISRIYRESRIKDRLANVRQRYFLTEHLLSSYFGFTEDEVDRLLTKKNARKEDKLKLQQYQNGYYIRIQTTRIFNPIGVIQFLDTGVVETEVPKIPLIHGIFKCLRHEKFFDQVSTIFLKQYIKFPLPLFMSKRELKSFVETVQTDCIPYNESTPYLTVLFDNGYFTYTSVIYVYNIPNILILNEIRREFIDFYKTIHNIDILNPKVGSAIHAFVNTEKIEYPLLNDIVNSLHEFMKPKRNTTLDPFAFKSMIAGVIFMNVNITRQPAVRKQGLILRTATAYDTIRVTSDDGKTLLIIHITYKRELRLTLKHLYQLAPTEPREMSVFSLIKYLGINYSDKNEVEVASCKNRDQW